MQSFPLNPSPPDAHAVERVFNTALGPQFRTWLCGGADEPFYRPANSEDPWHRIYYREDFVSSSLHELAHWLVAGPERRLLPDWGYWYAPDGRDAEQQCRFEQVEVKPQALEWLLHIACALPFRVSLDNLSVEAGSASRFKDCVFDQACRYLHDGIHDRALQLYRAFAMAFGGPPDLVAVRLRREDLD